VSAQGGGPAAAGPQQGQEQYATGPGGEPTEDELRAAYEAELSRLSTTDVMAQAAVSLLNLGARRMAPAGDPADPAYAHNERDLEQARDAIDAVRSLLEILERRIPQEVRPLRDALSRLQMAYAREVGPGGAPAGSQPAGVEAAAAAQGQPAGAGQEPGSGDAEPGQPERPPGPGPAESSGRLWVPGR
jgi:hypothetical protein